MEFYAMEDNPNWLFPPCFKRKTERGWLVDGGGGGVGKK